MFVSNSLFLGTALSKKKFFKGHFNEELAFVIKEWFVSALSCHGEEGQRPWA